MADEPEQDAPEDSTGERLDALEGSVGRIEELLNKVLGKVHTESTAKVERRLDRPTTVEEQVQAELQRADRERKEQERQAGIDSRLAALETPKPPPEQPPAPPVPLKQRILGWG